MIAVDVNVLLEVILHRSREAVCKKLLTDGKDKAISVLTLDLVMYFAERDSLPLRPIRSFLESFIWLPVVDGDAAWAFANFKGKDFEDALQIASALREQCEGFVTLDADLAKKYQRHLPVTLLR